MQFNNECALYQEIYKGAVMGCRSIDLLLPKVTNAALRSSMQTQRKEYQDTAKAAEKGLKELGQCPDELSCEKDMMLRMGTACKTLCNTETSHLAEMMIEGSNMGIITLTKVLNSTGSQQGAAVELARKTIEMEEANIERLKPYLQ